MSSRRSAKNSSARSKKKKSNGPSKVLPTRSSTVRNPLWTAVDRYVVEVVAPGDPVLDAAVADAERAGLPDIAVTPWLGKLLHVMARTVRAKRILEVGTLAGYSTIWLARALEPNGTLLTLEIDPKHAQVAAINIKRAGLDGTVEIRLGVALEIMPTLSGVAPFDLTFIDADKQNVPAYFDWAVKLSRPGALIVVDNVIRDGKVTDAKSADPSVRGIRAFNEKLKTDSRVRASTVQTVGAKGHDGFTIAVVN